jgi:hypothetical protein
VLALILRQPIKYFFWREGLSFNGSHHKKVFDVADLNRAIGAFAKSFTNGINALYLLFGEVELPPALAGRINDLFYSGFSRILIDPILPKSL